MTYLARKDKCSQNNDWNTAFQQERVLDLESIGPRAKNLDIIMWCEGKRFLFLSDPACLNVDEIGINVHVLYCLTTGSSWTGHEIYFHSRHRNSNKSFKETL